MHTEHLSPCIRMLQQGDAQALQTLFGLYHSSLVYFAQKLTHDKQVAEDIVAEVFFKLWMKHRDFHSLSSTKAFLYISVRNACFNYLDHIQYKAREQQGLLYLQEETEPSAADENALASVLHSVWHAVDKLPPKCRRIMQLSFRDGFNCKEIADQLHISVHTVRNQKVRGVMLIRQKLSLSRPETGKLVKRA